MSGQQKGQHRGSFDEVKNTGRVFKEGPAFLIQEPVWQ